MVSTGGSSSQVNGATAATPAPPAAGGGGGGATLMDAAAPPPAAIVDPTVSRENISQNRKVSKNGNVDLVNVESGQQDKNFEKIGGNSSTPKHDDGKSEKTWSSLFKDNRSSTSGAVLSKVTEGVSGNKVKISASELKDDDYVSRSLMGFFTPKFPGIEALNAMIGTWKHKCTVARHTTSWIVFMFASKEEACHVLDGGLYVSFGSVLHLRKMPRFFTFGREQQRAIPVWVQLHNLPLELWSTDLLAKVCSAIGRPLHTDQLTLKRERISFARCLVEIDVDADLPAHISIDLPDGTTLIQHVLYENKPLSCGKCRRLGHTSDVCKDTGLPSLYVMRKPKTKGGKEKKTEDPLETRVQVNRKKKTATTDTTATPELDEFGFVNAPSERIDLAASPPAAHNKEKTIVEEEVDKDESYESDNLDVDDTGEDSTVDLGDTESRGKGPVIGLEAQPKAHSHYPSPSDSVAPTPAPPPRILSGSKEPPKTIPPGYKLHVDDKGRWKLHHIWPSIQEGASLARTTRSKMK